MQKRSIASRLLVIGALSVLGIAPSSVAQTQRITFDDAVTLALERNVDLKKAENDVALQDQIVAREKADFLPDLNVSLRPSRSWGLTFDQTSFRQVTQKSDFFSVSASSSVNLFDGFGKVATLREAQHTLESSSLTLERRRQTVFFNVIQAYLQVILDKEQVQIRAEDVESQQQQLRRIEEFTRVGSRPISDLYQQQATLAASELQLLEAERAVQLSEVRLIQVLELDPLRVYDFDAPLQEDIDLSASTYELDALLQSSFQQRLDLQALDASIASSEEGIRAAKSGRYPSLTLFSSGGSSYSSLREEPIIDVNDQVTGFERVPFADQLEDNRSASLGLTLSIPIFNRLFTKTNIQQARIRHSNLGLDRQNLEQNIALEVRQAYLDYLTAVKRLDVTEKQVRSARQAEQVESERYDIGASTLVELTQARASLVDAESQRAQAVYQFVFQGKVIEYYLGTLNPSQTLFR
ncbi:MAG: TolC family protein [Rhodothermia bacterium]|nr:TolC family protein [Rhodothermia bacterium]